MVDPVTMRYRFKRGDSAPQPSGGVHPDVLRRSAYAGRVEQPSAFVLPHFPPQVQRAVDEAGVNKIAQDSAIMGNLGWAGQDPIYTAYAEGTVFLGYSALASMAQRAEYRVVTETIASEMTREWIDLKVASGDETKADKVKAIEDELDRLDAQHAFRKVAEYDGFFGRGHLYLDTGATDDPDELITDLGDGRGVISKLKIGPTKNQRLIRLQPVEATWAYPTFYESVDPLKKDWYAPVTWYVMSREIHRTRFLTFIGREVPDMLKPAYAFGGLAMSQMLKPYVDNWLRTRQSVSDMIQNFSHSVLKTNMDATTGVGGDKIFARVGLFNNIKNNQGTMILDKDTEDFTNVSAPVGTLDHLQAQCLPGDTLVTTDRGEIPIRYVTTYDKVLTRNGWAPLTWVGVTGYVPELVEITASDGSILRATSWHPIYNPLTNAFVDAGNVRVGDPLLAAPTKLTNTASRSHGAVVGGALLRRATTATSRLAAYCIGSFTRLISVLSRPDLRSTTAMRTVPAISLGTSYLRPEVSITPCIMQGSGAASRSRLNTARNALPAAASSRQSTLTPCTVVSSAIALPPILTAPPNGERAGSIRRHALSAAVGSRLVQGIRDCIAVQNAPIGPTTEIVSLNTVPHDGPVYNLEVADGYLPEFYANGVLVHNSQEHMAAISRIPLVKLLGIQPAGLNASSEGELIAFEDWIASFQETLFRDPLTTVIDFIQLSLWGVIDDDITFDFKPLRQMKPIELAQLETTKAQAREIYVQMGTVDAAEVREVLAQDPDSPFEGLDLSSPPPEPPMPEMPGMPGGGEGPLGGGGGGQGGPGGAGGMKPPSPPKPPPSPPKPPTASASSSGNTFAA